MFSVKDGVDLSEENVSQNPQRASGGDDVQRLETTETQLPVAEDLLQIEEDIVPNQLQCTPR